MKYTVVIEKAKGNFSAYLPDVPGCVATGKTRAQVRQRIRTALAMHLEGLREDGLKLPAPSTSAELIET